MGELEMGIERLPEVATLAHAVCVTLSIEQELDGQRWCYVPFEANDVDALCWESVEGHPSESVNHRVRYTVAFAERQGACH